MITRFAPSPTGYLHLGTAFSALTVYKAATQSNGRFLLRIEDIDQTRCKPIFEDALMEDLGWLGLQWETPVRRQSDHFSDYEHALQKLIDKGLVYRCFKTRKEIADDIARAPHGDLNGPDGPTYHGTPLSAAEEEEKLDAKIPFAWRLSMDRCRDFLKQQYNAITYTEEIDGNLKEQPARPEKFGDVILGRKDAGTSYHIASVHDDALQGITHVIRGDDLRPSAELHRLLQVLLELPAPIYRHHRLITDETGRRLAKRDKDLTIRSLRESGVRLEDIKQQIGMV